MFLDSANGIGYTGIIIIDFLTLKDWSSVAENDMGWVPIKQLWEKTKLMMMMMTMAGKKVIENPVKRETETQTGSISWKLIEKNIRDKVDLWLEKRVFLDIIF